MKEITIEIEESKYETFLDFIKTLDYVSVSNTTEINDWQKQQLDERLANFEEEKESYSSWNEVKNSLFDKHNI